MILLRLRMKPLNPCVETDFQTGSEPDVLFFFTGADASSFIEEGRRSFHREIRKSYPEYADNMDDAWLPANLVDENHYAVPVNGYWEGLFYNKEVLDQAKVAVPGKTIPGISLWRKLRQD